MPTSTKTSAKKKLTKKKKATVSEPKQNLTTVYHVRLSIPAEAALLKRAKLQGIGISTLMRRLLESALFS